MRWIEIINETSTSGSTSSGNIASIAKSTTPIIRRGSLGVGFDVSGDQGIYKKTKTTKAIKNKKLSENDK